MFARLTAKAILAAAAIAMAFFGIGLLGMALAAALVAWLGTAGGNAFAGLPFLQTPLIWAIVTHLSRPKKQPVQNNGAANSRAPPYLPAAAKGRPWIAIVGAGLAG